MVIAGTHAKILGAKISDKVLFTHGVHVPLHAKLVIFAAVLVSMATTFLTIRQSMKRGMMPAATPDNPMASSQKYMAYIMPFFALTGLYWPFGLVLYWVTTNVWTLGQQWLLGVRYPYTPPAPVDGAAPASVSPAAARSLTSGAGRTGRAAANGAATKASPDTKDRSTPTADVKSSSGAKRGTSATSGQRTSGPSTSGRGTAGQDGVANGVLKRLGRGRAEPEPEPEPEVKLVRHQTQRQSRSKRSGKR
jgi:YidC/Oxa1 family membrane protein insertase